MIVDDEDDLRIIMRELLEDESFIVFEATRGAEALLLLDELIATGDTPDLIILDIMMPGMDGFEVCKKIKNNDKYPHIPILIISGKEEQRSILDAYTSGANRYLTKPFGMDDLLHAVKTQIRQTELSRKQMESDPTC